MTSPEVAETTTNAAKTMSSKMKFGKFFQKKDKADKKEKPEKKEKSEKEEKTIESPIKRTESSSTADDGSAASGPSSRKNLFGMEKKKPRAEYQAEIDELKMELEFKDGSLNDTKNALHAAQTALQIAQSKLSRYQQWVRSAPAM